MKKFFGLVSAVVVLTTGCGQKATSSQNLNLKSAPLAGPSAARFMPLQNMMGWIGLPLAHAAVSSFSSFQLCNDTLVMTDSNGNTVKVNGKESEAGVGLLTFSPAATTPMSIASLQVDSGVLIKEVKITSAVNPTLCGNADFAVSFTPLSSQIKITQNTEFKFTFASPLQVSGSSQDVTLLFGSIVNAMLSQAGTGAGLTNSTIQSVVVGGVAQ